MFSVRGTRVILAGAFFSALLGGALASPQVVGDEACGYYDVDIASFATCIDGKVVKPEDTDATRAASRPARELRPPPAAAGLQSR